MTTASAVTGGRANQKTRTRRAIVDACRELVRTGSEVTMPEVARRALVSEATAYRYFPDLTSLLAETIDGLWQDLRQLLRQFLHRQSGLRRQLLQQVGTQRLL